MKKLICEAVRICCIWVLFFCLILLLTSCANTAEGFGCFLKGTGNLFNGIGEDFIDASSKQRSNRQAYIIEDTTKKESNSRFNSQQH